jgi:hypothetical protein
MPGIREAALTGVSPSSPPYLRIVEADQLSPPGSVPVYPKRALSMRGEEIYNFQSLAHPHFHIDTVVGFRRAHNGGLLVGILLQDEVAVVGIELHLHLVAGPLTMAVIG